MATLRQAARRGDVARVVALLDARRLQPNFGDAHGPPRSRGSSSRASWRRPGRTKGTRYFVPPKLLREAGLDRRTTLTRVEPHRLRALILEDLKRYPDSNRTDIHRRIGPEIHGKNVARTLKVLVADGLVGATGDRRWRTYRLA